MIKIIRFTRIQFGHSNLSRCLHDYRKHKLTYWPENPGLVNRDNLLHILRKHSRGYLSIDRFSWYCKDLPIPFSSSFDCSSVFMVVEKALTALS